MCNSTVIVNGALVAVGGVTNSRIKMKKWTSIEEKKKEEVGLSKKFALRGILAKLLSCCL